jgi:hypothetical protein
MVTPQVKKLCKEQGCTKNVAGGKSNASYAARKLGYCKYCYEMNFHMRKARGRYKLPVDPVIEKDLSGIDSEAFNPNSPWDWYEYFFPAHDR